MPLLDRVQKDMVDAMKARDEDRLSTLRMMKTALKKHEVDAMKPLDEAAEMQILKSLVKQRIEAAEMFRKGGREELAAKEEAERKLIESYLPAAAGEAEIEAAIAAALAETGVTSLKQMGMVMKATQAKLAGKTVDGKALSEKVRSRLAMTPPQTEKKFRSYVPDKTDMREFTFRAVLIGLVLTAVLGAANAYLGLNAGMTIAATYPAAVIGMALLRLMKGSLLEENIARTIGSIGESVAAGAIFTIPAFVLSRALAGRSRRQVLEFGGADGHRRHAGHSVCYPAAARDGGRSRASLPRIGGRVGDPQGGPAGIQSRQDSVCEHGLRRAGVPAGRRSTSFNPSNAFTRQHRRRLASGCCCAPAPIPSVATTATGGATIFPRRPSARPISASATSSDRAWRR